MSDTSSSEDEAELRRLQAVSVSGQDVAAAAAVPSHKKVQQRPMLSCIPGMSKCAFVYISSASPEFLDLLLAAAEANSRHGAEWRHRWWRHCRGEGEVNALQPPSRDMQAFSATCSVALRKVQRMHHACDGMHPGTHASDAMNPDAMHPGTQLWKALAKRLDGDLECQLVTPPDKIEPSSVRAASPPEQDGDTIRLFRCLPLQHPQRLLHCGWPCTIRSCHCEQLHLHPAEVQQFNLQTGAAWHASQTPSCQRRGCHEWRRPSPDRRSTARQRRRPAADEEAAVAAREQGAAAAAEGGEA